MMRLKKKSIIANKIMRKQYNPDFENYIREQITSRVCDVLQDITYEFADVDEDLLEECMDYATEFFTVHNFHKYNS